MCHWCREALDWRKMDERRMQLPHGLLSDQFDPALHFPKIFDIDDENSAKKIDWFSKKRVLPNCVRTLSGPATRRPPPPRPRRRVSLTWRLGCWDSKKDIKLFCLANCPLRLHDACGMFPNWAEQSWLLSCGKHPPFLFLDYRKFGLLSQAFRLYCSLPTLCTASWLLNPRFYREVCLFS